MKDKGEESDTVREQPAENPLTIYYTPNVYRHKGGYRQQRRHL